MSPQFSISKRFRNPKIWLLVLLLLVVSSSWAMWSSIAHQVITRELMGQMNDSGEVRLLFVGDTGFGGDGQKAVAELMEQVCVSEQPTAVVMLGDNFYYTGVESVGDSLWKSRFEDVYSGGCLKTKSFHAILGNHDYHGNPDAQIEYTRAGAGRWIMPARFYSLRFGDIVEIGAADTTIADRCGLASLCSVDWLIEKLKTTDARWKVLIGHHPILSGGRYRSLKGLAHYTLPDLYCRSNADVYVSGHDHGLQHLNGRYPTAKCDVEQFVSGAGGAPLYPVENLSQKTLFGDASFGFMLGRFSPGEMRFEVYKVGQAEPVYLWSKRQDQ